MPSPFPGMDPYLELPPFFPGIHDSMLSYLREALQPKLPEPYYAELNDRLWVEVSERPIESDVNILRSVEDSNSADERNTGGLAVRSAVEVEPVVIVIPHDEHREPFLEVFARIDGQERIVTTIEVLSFSNKKSGSEGRKLYLRKQREILRSQTNLVEIDLLRGGERTTGVPHGRAVHKAGLFDYHVCIYRFDRFDEFLIYPIRLRNRLPEIAIPLLPGDGDVRIDLQAVLNRSYDTGPYARRLRYAELQPDPPLSAEDAAWTADILTLSAKSME